MKWSISLLCWKDCCCTTATTTTTAILVIHLEATQCPVTWDVNKKVQEVHECAAENRLHKRVQTVFSLSNTALSSQHTHKHPILKQQDNPCVIHICMIHAACEIWSALFLTLSSSHGARPPSALKPQRNAAAQLIAPLCLSHSLSLSSLSALCLSPSVYLSAVLQKWPLCSIIPSTVSLPLRLPLLSSPSLSSFILFCLMFLTTP